MATAMASTQVDSFGKKMLLEVPSYMYKFIPLLGQVDNLIGVAEVRCKTTQLNSYVNVKQLTRIYNLDQKSVK